MNLLASPTFCGPRFWKNSNGSETKVKPNNKSLFDCSLMAPRKIGGAAPTPVPVGFSVRRTKGSISNGQTKPSEAMVGSTCDEPFNSLWGYGLTSSGLLMEPSTAQAELPPKLPPNSLGLACNRQHKRMAPTIDGQGPS